MPDIDDAESEVDRMDGVENAWDGRVLARLVRATRFLHTRAVILNNKVEALEARVALIESKLPPQ